MKWKKNEPFPWVLLVATRGREEEDGLVLILSLLYKPNKFMFFFNYVFLFLF
jgi:hypothetical protein